MSGKLELKMSQDTNVKGLLGETAGDGNREEIHTGTALSMTLGNFLPLPESQFPCAWK